MWPVEGVPTAAPAGWSSLERRTRWAMLLGGLGVVLAIALGTVLSIRAAGPPTSVYGSGGVGPAALWASGGTGFDELATPGAGPASNHADMAFDSARGELVLWDHGCLHLVMGFQGGCVQQVDRTWTWAGGAWTRRSPRSEPRAAAGAGAMAYDPALREVVYANGAGQAWAWDGSDWRALALHPPAAVRRGPAVAAGFDAAGRIVIVTLDSTWAEAGGGWTRLGGGIDYTDARADGAQLVGDPAHGQLVYVGKEYTWTWVGGAWARHAEPAFTSAAAAFDPSSGEVRLVSEDTQACDRARCHSTTWAWNGSAWNRVAGTGPGLPLSRSDAFPPAIAGDPAGRRLLVFVSAA